MRYRTAILTAMLAIWTSFACSGKDPQSPDLSVPNYDPTGTPPLVRTDTSEVNAAWDVPGGGTEVILGCLFGRDCIPSVENPELIPADAAGQLQDDDLVLGFVHEDDARAYPLRILDWHEIINDKFDNLSVSITYCPLTGSSVAIDISKGGLEYVDTNLKTFGVSGFLYNNNLIAYDRGTRSNWVQMLLRAVNGPLKGKPMFVLPIIETSWRTWKKMFPNSRVVSDNTGFRRQYDLFPYGDYRTNPSLLFPIMHDDKRLPRKERLHGIITDRFAPSAKTYPFSLFENAARAINDVADGQEVVVAGMQSADLYISYSRVAADGTVLTFDIKSESPSMFPFDLVDNEGSVWNVLGEAVAGPRAGEKLRPTVSYNAYWFAWGTLFPNVPIYGQ